MITVLFGEIRGGRLARLRYLGWSLFLGLLGIVIAVGIGFATGVAENVVGGDIESAQNQLRSQFGFPAVIFVVVCFVVLLFCSLNLMAKRIRDIGLSGWWMVLAFMVFGAVISTLLSEQLGSLFHFLVWLALLLVPTDKLGRSASL